MRVARVTQLAENLSFLLVLTDKQTLQNLKSPGSWPNWRNLLHLEPSICPPDFCKSLGQSDRSKHLGDSKWLSRTSWMIASLGMILGLCCGLAETFARRLRMLLLKLHSRLSRIFPLIQAERFSNLSTSDTQGANLASISEGFVKIVLNWSSTDLLAPSIPLKRSKFFGSENEIRSGGAFCYISPVSGEKSKSI